MLAVAMLACCVIYTVIMRYCFNISYTFLEEFITTLLAFITFWGVGICVIENEHVFIDSIYNMFPPIVKKVLSIFNYAIMLIVDGVMFRYGIEYVEKYGNQVSMGMRIPMIWMYGIIPLSMGVAFICILVRLIQFIMQPVEYFNKKKI